jgi:hypothetical protein
MIESIINKIIALQKNPECFLSRRGSSYTKVRWIVIVTLLIISMPRNHIFIKSAKDKDISTSSENLEILLRSG